MENNFNNLNMGYMLGGFKNRLRITIIFWNVICLAFYLTVDIIAILNKFLTTMSYIILLIVGLYILIYMINQLISIYRAICVYKQKANKAIDITSTILKIFLVLFNFALGVLFVVYGFLLKSEDKTLGTISIVIGFVIAITIFLVVLIVLLFKNYAYKRMANMQEYFNSLNSVLGDDLKLDEDTSDNLKDK